MISQRARLAFFQTAIGAALIFLALAGARASESIATSKTVFQLGGSAIHAEVFEPVNHRARAAILVLHGAGGSLLDGPEMRRVARSLAADGNAVYVLHYFDRTGTIFALDGTMQKNFETWLTIVREAIVAVQERRHDSSPIGIYGYSLGGFLTLAAASDNPRVGAIVEQAGGVWNGKMERIGKMPPVLMIHGRADARVPFAKYAQPLIPILRRRAAALETHFFADEGHVFTQPAMVQVRADAARFFRRHLGRGGESR